jgi:hypothetical protein
MGSRALKIDTNCLIGFRLPGCPICPGSPSDFLLVLQSSLPYGAGLDIFFVLLDLEDNIMKTTLLGVALTLAVVALAQTVSLPACAVSKIALYT